MSKELKEGGNMKMKSSKKQEKEAPLVEETSVEQPVVESKAVTYDDDTIKINMDGLDKESEAPKEEAPVKEEPKLVESVEEPAVEPVKESKEPVEEPKKEDAEYEVITDVTDEVVEDLKVDLKEAIEESVETNKPLPEDIQKVVNFMDETGGSLEDYVLLNKDIDELNEDQLLSEYYAASKPHLNKEEIAFLIDDKFIYDEDIDTERDVRKKQIAKKESISDAKRYLNSQKEQYYSEIKAGSRLAPEQKKAVEFFNRYTEESEVKNAEHARQKEVFLQGTGKVFAESFKGFDYSVGDKKYRFNVKNPTETKETQSDINNFVKKFLNDKNEMVDPKGYHKSLFTAMNSDAVAKHFYEQGKADAMKESITRSKNVDMDPRGVHEKVTTSNGWTVRAVPSDAKGSSQFKIKKIT